MLPRTSRECPLRIDEVCLPAGGVIGMTICPGKKDVRRGWDRDLERDMEAVAVWRAAAMVTLLEDHEFELLQVRNLPYTAIGLGLAWFHLPIRDVSIPDFRFHDRWCGVGERLLEMLECGGRVLIHCRGGLGRSGVVAAMLLIRSGFQPGQAVEAVRLARPGAIETVQQEAFVMGCRNMPPRRAVHRTSVHDAAPLPD